jgi:hypothetical protein
VEENLADTVYQNPKEFPSNAMIETIEIALRQRKVNIMGRKFKYSIVVSITVLAMLASLTCSTMGLRRDTMRITYYWLSKAHLPFAQEANGRWHQATVAISLEKVGYYLNCAVRGTLLIVNKSFFDSMRFYFLVGNVAKGVSPWPFRSENLLDASLDSKFMINTGHLDRTDLQEKMAGHRYRVERGSSELVPMPSPVPSSRVEDS